MKDVEKSVSTTSLSHRVRQHFYQHQQRGGRQHGTRHICGEHFCAGPWILLSLSRAHYQHWNKTTTNSRNTALMKQGGNYAKIVYIPFSYNK